MESAMRMIGALGLVAVVLACAPAWADTVPPFKGNDTGGIIAYPLGAQGDVRQLAVDHCARYGKVVKFLAVDPQYGGHRSLSLPPGPYGTRAQPLVTQHLSFFGIPKSSSKNDIQQTAAGYTTDSVCSVAGVSMTSHSDITGDFNSAYTVKTTSHNEGAPSGVPRDSTMTIEAKWLGACKPDQKPGDIVMPGGFKLNIKDADKLKNLLPK